MKPAFQKTRLTITPLLAFSTIIFLISLHDGIMSYTSPVILNSKLNDAFLVGLVLSSSSFFGILFDLIIATFYDHKSYRFFVPRMLFFALLFPSIFLFFPDSYVSFILAMASWSIYYEFRNYSKYNFVHEFLPPKKNTEAWSTMQIFQSTSYMIGPALAVILIKNDLVAPLHASLIIVSSAILFYLLFLKNYGKKKVEDTNNTDKNLKELLLQFKIFKVLSKKLWCLIFFSFTLTLLDVSFWTIGVLYSEKLRQVHELGGMFIVVYGLPAIFVGLITPHIYQKLGKKRTAFATGILAGLNLLGVGLSSNVYLILLFVFLTATFYGITFILVSATFEDYITRLDGAENDIVSMNQLSQNVAYMIGPAILGLITNKSGFGTAFISVGLLLIASGIVSYLVVPRKIRMPRKELSRIE